MLDTTTPQADPAAEQEAFLASLESDRSLGQVLMTFATDGGELSSAIVEAAAEFVARGEDKVSRAKRQLAAFQARVKSAQEEAAGRLKLLEQTIGIERLTRYVLANANKGKQTLVTPSATLAVRQNPGGPRVADEDALRDALAMEGMTEFLETPPAKVLWAALKKRLMETGEDLPGLEFVEPTASLSISSREG